jgi:hypothetical protein
MENKQQQASLFITKLRERKDKNGNTYFIGSMGMATMMLRRHKTNQDEWNMFLMEPLKKEGGQQGYGASKGGFAPQSGGGYAGQVTPPDFDEEIPF